MNPKRILLFFCLLLVSLTACAVQAEASAEAMPTVTIIETPISPTATSSPVPTETAEPQPVTEPTPLPTEESLYPDSPALSEEVIEEIKEVINAYIDLRYQSYVTLAMQDFSSLTSDSEIAQELLQQEIGKLTVELKRKEIYNNRYAEYSLSLEYYSFTPGNIENDLEFNPLKDNREELTSSDFDGHNADNLVVQVVLTENSEFIYQSTMELEPENPTIAGLSGRVHTVILEKNNGQWKIISDYYNDFLWDTLRNTDATVESLLEELKED
ncbi:MAG: hypothetical protein V2J07_07700 [Anaerolineae bacterium]|jgi:hypothetical protein|nr:hypothetical protein [Anaerolineae bacterium]